MGFTILECMGCCTSVRIYQQDEAAAAADAAVNTDDADLPGGMMERWERSLTDEATYILCREITFTMYQAESEYN